MSSKPLRVTFLSSLPLESSTIIGRVIPLAAELQKNGHLVKLITLGKFRATPANLPVPAIIAGPAFRDTNNKPNYFKLMARYFSAKKGLRQAITAAEPNVIVLVKPHPQNYSAVKNIAIPVVLDSDDDERYSSRSNWFEKILLESINKRAARKAKLITACSPYLVERYKQICPAIPAEFIPTVISENTPPESLDLRRYFGLTADAQILLYLGSLAVSSGHRVDHILTVWNEISAVNSKLHLIFAGDGIDEDIIRSQVKYLSNNNRIHFFGRFQSNQAESFARQANLMADPVDNSFANQAKSSSRVLLALKTGTPVMTGNVGIRSMFVPKTARDLFFYETNNPQTLAAKINFGLTPEARQHFVTATHDCWRQWTWNTIGAKFSALLEHHIK